MPTFKVSYFDTFFKNMDNYKDNGSNFDQTASRTQGLAESADSHRFRVSEVKFLTFPGPRQILEA